MKAKPHLITDSYKVSHKFQYPEGTQFVFSNLTARSTNHAPKPEGYDDKVVFVGLQGFALDFLINTWNEGFFHRPKAEVIAEYKRRMDTFLGPDSVPVDHFEALHDLGYLPIRIDALPEGSRVNVKVPFLTIRNTHPAFFWLTNYLETVLSNELWKQITNATIAYEYRRILNKYVELTGSSPDFANWQIHDFSMRGMSGWVDAAKCGFAHLVGTQGFGTDTLPAIDYAEQFYMADATKELIGGSVPATEHSVMCMGGKETEIETFRRLINVVHPTGVVSIVSDTWDFWHVITEMAAELKEDILAREENALGLAKVVFRPDSGDPVNIVAGLRVVEISALDDVDHVYDANPDVVKYNGKYYEYTLKFCYFYSDDGEPEQVELGREVPEHEVKGAVECLWETFGGDYTEKGYKTLNQRVGLIYGDSITLERAEAILSRLAAKGFSAGNIVFGVGSYTYQHNTRDTYGMAVKATWGQVNGEHRELFKDPATDSGTKKSAKGLIRVTKGEDGNYVLHDQQTPAAFLTGDNALEPVFEDGKMIRMQSLAGIRERLSKEA